MNNTIYNCNGCGCPPGTAHYRRCVFTTPTPVEPTASPERWLQIRCVNEGSGRHSAYNIRYPIGLGMFQKLDGLFTCEHCNGSMLALPDTDSR